MEIFLPSDKIDSIELVTKGKAEEALRKGNKEIQEANRISRIFCRTVTMIKAEDRVFFFEIPAHKEFKNTIIKLINKEKN